MPFPYPDFARDLATWFKAAQRVLPWREAANARDPYRIAVSEFMLQQTTVAAVIPYYERFLERFPSAESLAEAELDDVLALWAGLGYYSRARNLHALGKAVAAGGGFPRSLEGVLALPGVGRYTAGAITSIAYDEATPIVDANVARVFARVFLLEGDLKRKENATRLWAEAAHTVEAANAAGIAPSLFNPGLMELGALVCTPKNPSCDVCPVAAYCEAKRQKRQNEIPFVPQRAAATEMSDVCVRLIGPDGNGIFSQLTRPGFWLRQRSHDPGIWWRGMWELPRTTLRTDAEGRLESPATALDRLLMEELGLRHYEIGPPVKRIVHGVTVYKITLDCYEVQMEGTPRGAEYFEPDATDPLAMPSAMRRLVRDLTKRDAEPKQGVLF